MQGLTVIVPATDAPATLVRCLDAIHAAREGPDEVIVVSEPCRSGPARARNAGARRARGDVLAFVDSDVVVHPDAFARMRAAFDSDPGLAAIFGSYDEAPSARGTVSGFRNLLHHHVHQSSAGPAQTFWAGLGAVRSEAFHACGGFDERLFPFPSVEDVDLGMRIARTGGRCRLDPAIQGTHLKAWTLRSMVVTDFVRRGVPWSLLLLRARAEGAPVPGALNVAPRQLISAGLAVAAAIGIAARRPLAGAAALSGMAILNRDLYALIARRRGRPQAALGIPLHAVHLLTAAASVPVAAALFARGRVAAAAEPGTAPQPLVVQVAAGPDAPVPVEQTG